MASQWHNVAQRNVLKEGHRHSPTRMRVLGLYVSLRICMTLGGRNLGDIEPSVLTSGCDRSAAR